MANSYLSHTTSTPTNSDKATLSFWLKRSLLSSGRGVFAEDTNGTNKFAFILGSNDTISIFQETAGTVDINLVTNRKFRDTSAWYHIVVAYDSSQGSASDRVKLYVNGSQETSFSTSTYPSSNVDFRFNKSGIAQEIGRYEGGNYFDGYLTHVSFVDGQALAPTVFGQTDSTSGIWKFKQPSGVTWGTNGFWLKFENSGNLGLDSSGNSNTFTVNGNGRQALDTPSNVHATMNPLDNGAGGTTILLANGNNTFMANSGSGDYGLKSTLGVNSGKYYWEFKDMAQGQTCGTCEMDMRIVINKNGGSGLVGSQNWTVQRYSSSEMNIYNNGTYSKISTLWGGSNSGDIYSIALDCDNGKIFMQKNGGGYKDLSGNTGDPVNGTNPTFSGLATDGSKYYGAWTENRGNADNSCHYNFGNGYFGTTAISSAGSNGNGSLFEYDVPSGYYALNTKNINTYG